MKHNNIIPNTHFKKDWQRYIKTWFNQPAQKKIRRDRRIAKAKKMGPRPTHMLKPVVRCPTLKYNTKLRLGRGFTMAELKAAGISVREAPTVGICVDYRRKNRSEERFQANVDRLKEYKQKLVVFPRRASQPKKGDATKEEIAQVVQVHDREVIPFAKRTTQKFATRVITEEEKKADAFGTLRQALTDEKMWGIREKRAREKAEEEKSKKK